MDFPSFAVDCYSTIRRCPPCEKGRTHLSQHGRQLQAIPASASLKPLDIHILGKSTETALGNRNLLIISNKLNKSLDQLFWNSYWHLMWIKLYWTHECSNAILLLTLSSINENVLLKSFFISSVVYWICRISLQLPTVCKTNKVERYNWMFKTATSCNVEDHHADWGLYTSLLIYFYHCIRLRSRALDSFMHVLLRPRPIGFEKQL